ncbi:MAG TPA: M3 family oligoendopeptidase [Chitinophagaceae bacterium]|nr:M3 family oligoendopeptidase [Chitinophagaceae bacterium]
MNYSADIQKLPRHFVASDFEVRDWASLEPYFQDLLQRPLPDRQALEQWLRDLSELEAVLSEDACWRQIRMTCDTENKALEEAFNYFMLEIQPRIQPVSDQLNRKLLDCPFTRELDQATYFTYLRNVRKNIELFREQNVPLQAELAVLGQQFGVISGKMTVTIEGREYTLQQAMKFLESPDRSLRERVYRQVNERRLQDKDALDDLFNKLVSLRDQVARNAGFANYRDFRFVELGRFDYTKEDCFRFQEAVRDHVLPLVDRILRYKQEKLGLPALRPWDTEAEPAGVEPLHPFTTGAELLEKSIRCFRALDPFFGACLEKMRSLGHLDLESRKGKAPGGYNCPLAESGAPFIFMNAAGQMTDVTTMLHEGGHAVHSFLAHHLELNGFKDYPMEIAEVASMSMELFTMDHWDVFFDNRDDLVRARIHQLERVITIFPWIALIDRFQHWIYENPGHSPAERASRWMELQQQYTSPVLDLSGLDEYRRFGWQRQLHLYEVPFYYIEYGIAQLGAIGMWKQYRENPSQALNNYTRALSLGGTRTLPELFAAAGLRFDLSGQHIKNLMDFVGGELDALTKA